MNVDDLRPVMIVLVAASLAVAGLMMGGTSLFGDEVGEKAKKRVMLAVQGLVLFSVATALVAAFA